MSKPAPRDEEILARLRERFPADDESRRQLSDAVSASASALGEIFGAFLLQAGVSKEQVAAMFRELAAAVTARELRIEPDTRDVWRQVSDAVTLWWRSPDYLDEDGQPRDLPEFGPRPSLESLLAATVAPALQAEAKSLLRGTVATETEGIWHFEEDKGHLRVSGGHGVERLLIGVSGMLTTYLDNQRRRRDLPVAKNFDGTALVHAYPLALVPELRAKLIRRLQFEMEQVDELLMAGEREDVAGPVAMVGVTMFMHTATPRPRREPRDAGRRGVPDSTAAPAQKSKRRRATQARRT